MALLLLRLRWRVVNIPLSLSLSEVFRWFFFGGWGLALSHCSHNGVEASSSLKSKCAYVQRNYNNPADETPKTKTPVLPPSPSLCFSGAPQQPPAATAVTLPLCVALLSQDPHHQRLEGTTDGCHLDTQVLGHASDHRRQRAGGFDLLIACVCGWIGGGRVRRQTQTHRTSTPPFPHTPSFACAVARSTKALRMGCHCVARLRRR